MLAPFVTSDRPVTLVGGGVIDPGDLSLSLSLAPVPVGADGGGGVLLRAGVDPVAVIGDFDSLSPDDQARIPAERLHHLAEQESTDFDKAMRAIKAPVVLAVGFLGGRLDHQLAVLNALVRLAPRPCILIGATEIVFHVPPRLKIDLAAGEIVSLFPMRRVTGRSEGLEWPIDGLELAPDGRVGTSNRATGPVCIETDGPGLLATLPRSALSEITQSFL